MATSMLLGSSYVSRLQRYTNSHLKIPGFVYFLWKGGMKTNTVPDDFIRKIRTIVPDCVVIHLGGNDISESSQPKDIVFRLLKLYDDILKLGVKKVFIGEILTREPSTKHGPGLSKSMYDIQRLKINCALRRK